LQPGEATNIHTRQELLDILPKLSTTEDTHIAICASQPPTPQARASTNKEDEEGTFLNKDDLHIDLENSDKFDVVLQLLKCCEQKPCKAVVFCSWVTPLQLLRSSIAKQWPNRFCGFLSGILRTTPQKDKVLMDFRNSPCEDAILLSVTNVGGVGISMIEAQCCIFLNDDWNPQTDMQAISRLWRGGQTKRVNVFHLLMDNDIERRVHERSESKIQLQTWFDKQVRTEGNGIRYGCPFYYYII